MTAPTTPPDVPARDRHAFVITCTHCAYRAQVIDDTIVDAFVLGSRVLLTHLNTAHPDRPQADPAQLPIHAPDDVHAALSAATVGMDRHITPLPPVVPNAADRKRLARMEAGETPPPYPPPPADEEDD